MNVPTLDVAMFLHPRKSQVDVIQAVGRVMRRAPNKKEAISFYPLGYRLGLTQKNFKEQ